MAAGKPAAQGEFLVAQAQDLRGARGHQRKRLQHLHGGARKDRAIDVTERGVDSAVGIDDGQRAAMKRLDQATTQGFGEDGVG